MVESFKPYTHDLIKEFRHEICRGHNFVAPEDTSVIVVLSAPPAKQFIDDEIRRERTAENRVRISFGIEMVKSIVARRLGKKTENLTRDDLAEDWVPYLVLDGDEHQVKHMGVLA